MAGLEKYKWLLNYECLWNYGWIFNYRCLLDDGWRLNYRWLLNYGWLLKHGGDKQTDRQTDRQTHTDLHQHHYLAWPRGRAEWKLYSLTVTLKKKNSAYRRHWITWHVPILAPIFSKNLPLGRFFHRVAMSVYI